MGVFKGIRAGLMNPRRLVADGKNDVAFTLRALGRSPGFAIVAVLTLAVGIGGTTAVFSAVDAVLLRPLPYADAGQLVRLYQNYGKGAPEEHGFVTPVYFVEARDQVGAIASSAAVLTYSSSGADIGRGDDARRIQLLPVSADYFDVIRVHPALGHPFDRSQERDGVRSVIVSHALWEKTLHGDPAAVGRTMTMNGAAYEVAGVMPAGFADPIADSVDAWVPMDLAAGHDATNASNHYLSVVARLRPGVTVARAQAELAALDRTLGQRFPDAVDKHAHIVPLKEDIVGSSSRALTLMLGAVALVLVLVCVNMANLLLVRGTEHAREFAVRSALGAERARLVRQMLVESLTLALLGDLVGLAVARLGMAAIAHIGAASIPRLSTMQLDLRLLAFSVVIASLSSVAFGLWPAIRAARTQPSDVLRQYSRGATGGGQQLRLRDWLVVSQVALAFVLLVGAGLLIASFRQLRDVQLGVNPEHALVFELNLPSTRYDSTQRAQFYERFASQVQTINGVRAVGGISKLPATGQYNTWGVGILSGPLGNTKQGELGADQRVVSGDYFHAAGIPLVEGRLLDARDDATQPNHVVISRALATQYFPGISAIGQRLRTGGRDDEIVGVVGDVATNAEGHVEPHVYHAHTQFAGDRNWALTQVVRVTGDPVRVQGEVRRVLASLDAQLVMYKPTTLAEAIGRGEAQRAFTLQLLGAFALIALAVAGLGLFGVLSYGVRLRSREFGIRMALGAPRAVVRRMVLRQGLTVAAIGTAIGLLGAAAAARLMTAVVFHVRPLEPSVLIAAVAFMAVVAGLAAYLPARRATAVDPRSVLQ